MELKFLDYQYFSNNINFTIKDDAITGIIGSDKEKLVDIIKLRKNYKGKSIFNNEEIGKENITFYKKKITVIKEELEYSYYTNTIYELMKNEIKRKRISLKNPEKKMLDSLKIVSLNIDLNRSIYSLSTSEKKHLQIAISLLSNPDILIIEEPFKDFDIKNEKKIILLLQKIKEQYKKTIIFVSDDSTMLYKYTNNIIIFRNKKIIVEGPTTEVFKRVDFLKRNKIEIPKIVEFTYLAKKNKFIKLDYHKDIRDIIKDIYKHV